MKILLLFTVTCLCLITASSESLPTSIWLWDDPPSFSDGDFQLWLDHIEQGCKDKGIPANKWADVGVKHLNGELKAVMEHRSALMMAQTGQSEWDWADFRQDLTRICEHANRLTLSSTVKSASEFAHKFIEKDLSAILGKAAGTLEADVLSPHVLTPLKSAAHLIGEFTAEHIPVIHDAGQAMAKFYDEKVSSAIKDIERFIKENIYPALQDEGRLMEKFVAEHPYIAAGAGVSLIVAGSVVLFPDAALIILEAVGFSQTGPVPGTVAAAVQSMIYAGSTTGVFSALQAFTMTAAPVATEFLAVAVIAVASGLWLTLTSAPDLIDAMKSDENVIRGPSVEL